MTLAVVLVGHCANLDLMFQTGGSEHTISDPIC